MRLRRPRRRDLDCLWEHAVIVLVGLCLLGALLAPLIATALWLDGQSGVWALVGTLPGAGLLLAFVLMGAP